MAGVEEQVAVPRGADDRRAVRRHRAQAGPVGGAADVAALREQIRDHEVERPAPGRIKRQVVTGQFGGAADRSEEHTSELQSLMRTSYAVFCLKQNKNKKK